MKMRKVAIVLIVFLVFLSPPLLSQYICLARLPQALPSHSEDGGVLLLFYSSETNAPAENMRVRVRGYQDNRQVLDFRGFTTEHGMLYVPVAKDNILQPGEVTFHVMVFGNRRRQQFVLSLPVYLPASLEWHETPHQEESDILLKGELKHPFSRASLWKYPVEVRLKNMDDQTLHEKKVKSDEEGVFSCQMPVSEDWPEGWYFVYVYYGGQTSRRLLFVQHESDELPVSIEDTSPFYLPGEKFRARFSLETEDEVLRAATKDVQVQLRAGGRKLQYEKETIGPERKKIKSRLPAYLEENDKVQLTLSLETEHGKQEKEVTFSVFEKPFYVSFLHQGYVVGGFENLFGLVLSDPVGNPLSKWVHLRIEDEDGETVYKRQNVRTSPDQVSFFRFKPPADQETLYFNFSVEGHHFRYEVEPLSIAEHPFLFQPENYAYDAGEMLHLDFESQREFVPVMVEIERDGQLLYARDLSLENGRRRLSIRLTEEMVGNCVVTAYTYNPAKGYHMMSYPFQVGSSRAQPLYYDLPDDSAGGLMDKKLRALRLTETYDFIKMLLEKSDSSMVTLMGRHGEWHEVRPEGFDPAPLFSGEKGQFSD